MGRTEICFIMMALICMNWLIALGIDVSTKKYMKKALMIISVTINIGILFVYKYVNFVIDNINKLVGVKILIRDIAMPIGISFFSFQVLSYVLDVYLGREKAAKNLLHVALYASMFPQLIAGPIVRYSDIRAEICERKAEQADLINGLRRFVIGLSKKMLLADLLAILVNEMFLANEVKDGLTVLSAWMGAIAYTLQIYFDFSGYSDMAIGLGKCFGFHYGENFIYPYTARSVSEFWKRWHISLTDWFRDYVYIRLGGSKCSKWKHMFNLFIVWLLTGIWHGANWTFIIWGLIYFAIQYIEKKLLGKKRLEIIGNIYTLFCVTLCWVIFRSESVKEACTYIAKMFGIGARIVDETATRTLSGSWKLFLISVLCCIPWKNMKLIEKIPVAVGGYNPSSNSVYVFDGLAQCYKR